MVLIHKACPQCENETIYPDANFCQICGLDLRKPYSAELDKSYTLKPINKSSKDCQMTIDEFIEHVDCGGIMDDDGHGRYATATEETNIYVDCDVETLEAIKAEGKFTHVMWYNK